MILLDIEEEQRLSRESTDKAIVLYEDTDTPITCKGGGCFGCCSLSVSCFPEEVQRLTELVLSGEVEIDTDRLKRKVMGSDKIADNWCPFLKNGDCSVHEHRPIMCSRMIVTSEPKHCHPISKIDKKQVMPKDFDNRYSFLALTFGQVKLHIALYNLLMRNGFIK